MKKSPSKLLDYQIPASPAEEANSRTAATVRSWLIAVVIAAVCVTIWFFLIVPCVERNFGPFR